jgi:hypothetical protein
VTRPAWTAVDTESLEDVSTEIEEDVAEGLVQ